MLVFIFRQMSAIHEIKLSIEHEINFDYFSDKCRMLNMSPRSERRGAEGLAIWSPSRSH